MITIDLSSTSILVTGALGAIAEHVVRRLHEAGADLILTDILEPAAAAERLEARKLQHDRIHYAPLDVTDDQKCEKALAEITAARGIPSIVIGLAGGCALHPFRSTAADEYERIFRFNYFGQINVTRAITRRWLERDIAGHFIYTSSLVATLPWVDLSAYNPAKAAVEMFARCMALEFAPQRMRFNCVAPGHTAAGTALHVYETDPVYRAMTDRVIPLQRLVKPQSIADAFLYLCSPMADDVNGQVIRVDCGASIPKVG